MCARVDECLTATSMRLIVCLWSHMFLFEAVLLWFWSISISVSYSMDFTHLCVFTSMFVSHLAYCCYSNTQTHILPQSPCVKGFVPTVVLPGELLWVLLS